MARFVGTNRNDRVQGNPNEPNLFEGFGIGADSVTGGRLNDVFTLFVDEQRDSINGSGGRDVIDYSAADRSVFIRLAGASPTDPGQVTAQFGRVGSISDPLRTEVVADLVNIEDAIGSRYADQIYGTDGVNMLDGRGGADVIYGFGDADVLLGGGGNDTLDGGSGNDRLTGGAGADVLRGGLNEDTAIYDDSPTAVLVDLNGGFGDGGYATGDTYNSIENVVGSGYDDDLRGDYGTNRIFGGNGADTIYGRSGNDFLYGEGGNDTLLAGWGASAEHFDGGVGTDTLSFRFATDRVYVSLGTTTADNGGGPVATVAARAYEFSAPGVPVQGSDTIVNIENVIGSYRDDIIFGSDGDNVLSGGSGGNDSIDGAAGTDVILPGFGADNIKGGPGSDTISFADRSGSVEVNLDIAGLGARAWDLTATGAIVDGTVDNLNGIENITGGSDRDFLWGDGNGNVIDGQGNNDFIRGKGGSDTLIGGAGADFIDGGAGSDILSGGSEADTFSFDNPNDGVDTVTDFQADLDTLMFFGQNFGFGIVDPDIVLYEGTQLINGANPTATAAQPTFLFNTVDHILYFDLDGIGAAAATAIVQLPQTTHLDYITIG